MASPPTNHIRNIAIVGATGHLGKHITAEPLKNSNFTITALTRSADTSSFPKELKIVPVDYSDSTALTTALKGQDALIITLSVTAPPDTQSELIKAAAEAAVPWVLPNGYGNDTDDPASDDTRTGSSKRAERKLIEELGVSSWIGVVSGFWYEYLLSGPGLYGIDIAKREFVWLDEGTQKLGTSTWVQVGRAISSLSSLPIETGAGEDKPSWSQYHNKIVHISSFAVNQREMLDSLNRVMHLSDKDWKVTTVGAKQRFEDSQKMLAEGNRMGFAYMLYTRYFFPWEDAALYYKTKTRGLENESLGLPVEDLDETTKKAVEMAEEGYFAKLRYGK